MKYEIVEVDHQRGIVRVTTPDERWYSRQVSRDGTEENKRWDFVPSVTWIADFWPKDARFFKWLASKGWSEAEAIKSAAGDKGSKVHQACGVLMNGGTVSIYDKFENPRSLDLEPITHEEYACVMSFKDWFDEMRPEILAIEYTVWNERYRYAGTVDIKCRINGKIWIVDIKTSPDVWPQYEIQLSAYKHADPDAPKSTKLAILQLGYRRNKVKKWKWNPVADQFNLFRSVRQIWKKQTDGDEPLQRDYPLSISLAMPMDLRGAKTRDAIFAAVTENEMETA